MRVSVSDYLFIRFQFLINLEPSEQVYELISHSGLKFKLLVRDTAVDKSLEHREIEMMMSLKSVEVH